MGRVSASGKLSLICWPSATHAHDIDQEGSLICHRLLWECLSSVRTSPWSRSHLAQHIRACMPLPARFCRAFPGRCRARYVAVSDMIPSCALSPYFFCHTSRRPTTSRFLTGLHHLRRCLFPLPCDMFPRTIHPLVLDPPSADIPRRIKHTIDTTLCVHAS